MQLTEAISIAKTQREVESCFLTLLELRPKLKEKTRFISQVLRQMEQGYILSYLINEDEVVACMGFRIFETLAWGRILYIDDLITREKSRKRGFGKTLLNYAIERARLESCAEVHLDSGHQRYDAHRLYLNRGFVLHCHHFSLIL